MELCSCGSGLSIRILVHDNLFFARYNQLAPCQPSTKILHAFSRFLLRKLRRWRGCSQRRSRLQNLLFHHCRRSCSKRSLRSMYGRLASYNARSNFRCKNTTKRFSCEKQASCVICCWISIQE